MQSFVPYKRAVALTKSDDVQQPDVHAIFVGASGNLVVKMRGSDTAVTLVVQDSQIIPIAPAFIMETTTADKLVGLLYG